MYYRWLGALLIVTGCGGFGYTLTAEYKKQEILLKALLQSIKTMQWELQYRLTPLPELCQMAGKQAGGKIGKVFCGAAKEMEQQLAPNAESCLLQAISREPHLPHSIRLLLKQLGISLGRYDLSGQLEGLEAVAAACHEEQESLQEGRQERFRSYRTLSICAGAALAILFL